MEFPVNCVPFDKWFAFKGVFPPNAGEHRMIIVYRMENKVTYFYVTSYESEEEKKKINLNNRRDIASVAELSRADWDSLTKDSCVQCNLAHLHDTTIENLQTGYELGTVQYIGAVPDIVKNKIIAATCASDSFTDTQKKLYTI